MYLTAIIIICVTAVAITYLLTHYGLTVNMTYTNKDKETLPEIIQPTDEEKQRGNMDSVISEIYDAFDINIKEADA